MRHVLIGALLAIAAAGIVSADDNDTWDLQDFIPAPAWQEQAFTLPPYPQDDDLLEVSIDAPGSPFTFFIDEKSLSIGEDRVVRYTAVLVSDSGARNVFYEGLRCDSGEYKLYAYDTGSGRFTEARDPKWQSVSPLGSTRYRYEFLQYYFCDRRLPLKRHEMLQRIKYPAGPR